MSSLKLCPVKLAPLILLVVLGARSAALAQGSLTPTGAPAPTMKSLAQIEPRTPISALPFTIVNPGAYYLTTNLTGINASHGITISTNDVTLDLNGFSLLGAPGALTGIFSSSQPTGVTVRNGTIRNWPNAAINFVGTDTTFDGLNVYSNSSSFAVTAGTLTKVRNCTVALNAAGLSLGQGSVVSDSFIRHNTGHGLQAGDATAVRHCTIFGNGGSGVVLGNASSMESCTIRTNGQNGIIGLANNNVTRCNISQNNSNGVSLTFGSLVTGCVVSSNKVDGIRISARCTVTGNHCDYNGTTGNQAGIRATSTDNRIDENNLTVNINGILSDVGYNLILRNKATLTTTNYAFHAQDLAGPTSSSPGTAGPWANFAY